MRKYYKVFILYYIDNFNYCSNRNRNNRNRGIFCKSSYYVFTNKTITDTNADTYTNNVTNADTYTNINTNTGTKNDYGARIRRV